MEDRIESLGGHELLRCAHDVLRQLARSEDVRKACEGDLAVAKARVEQQVQSKMRSEWFVLRHPCIAKLTQST